MYTDYSTSYEMTPAGTRVTPSVPTSIAPSAPPAPAPSAPPAYHVALDINAYPAVKPDEVAFIDSVVDISLTQNSFWRKYILFVGHVT